MFSAGSLNYLYFFTFFFFWPHVSFWELDEIYESTIEKTANMYAYMQTHTYSQFCIQFLGKHGPPEAYPGSPCCEPLFYLRKIRRSGNTGFTIHIKVQFLGELH